jgi:iron complex transport system ATP-binding protein
MSFISQIEGIQALVKDNILVIQSKTPLRILSSAIFNGGLKYANSILNIQVPEGLGSDKNDVHWNPEGFLNEQVQNLLLEKDKTVALMTAAKMQNLAFSYEKSGEVTLTVFATAGKTVAVTAGEPAASKNGYRIGTINIILLIDGNLTEGCMVEIIKTITEAKTVALRELDLRSQFSGDLATGTLTDSVLVGCTNRGETIHFAGTFTLLGESIGKCVREAVKSALFKQEKLVSTRSLLERLAERGITPKVISSLKPELKKRKAKLIQEEFELLFSDKNICSLVIAGLRLDEDYMKGLIPEGLTNEIDKVTFEELLSTTFKYHSNDDDSKSMITTEPVFLGPITKCLLLSILEKACLCC